MDILVEQVVPKKLGLKDNFNRFLGVVLPLTLALYINILFAGSALRLFAILIAAGLFWLSYYIFNLFYYEYEYSMVSTEITFSKIINKKKRKDILKVDTEQMEFIARTNNEEKRNDLLSASKRYDFTSGIQGRDKYFFVYNDDRKGRVAVVFEPNEKMIDAFNKACRSKISI